jgi:hypothetical protein
MLEANQFGKLVDSMGDVSEKWVIEDRSARAEKQQHFSCISVQ